jgi:hypothetical protein
MDCTWVARQSKPLASASPARQLMSACASSLREVTYRCGYPGPFCVALLSHGFKAGTGSSFSVEN